MRGAHNLVLLKRCRATRDGRDGLVCSGAHVMEGCTSVQLTCASVKARTQVRKLQKPNQSSTHTHDSWRGIWSGEEME